MTSEGAPSESFGNFDLVKRLHCDNTSRSIHISKWHSRTTGFSIIHLDYDAPMINAYFTVPTEIFEDTGCPHTLEHLVFMGSERYPHSGLLHRLADRACSSSANAATYVDRTVYTISTAGQQGFLQLIPVFIDHILYPKITEAAFITEVYHVNSSGEDSGVVFSEMQGRENEIGSLMSLRMRRLMNPPGSGYRSETGGLMEALRKLTVEEIRAYHSAYYAPHNLTLVVAGSFLDGTNALLSFIQEQVEPTLIAHGQNKGPRPPGWKRPFMETPSAIRGPYEKTVVETIEFPDKDERLGHLWIAYMGPATNAFLERQALSHLFTYLAGSKASPLNKEYIEIPNPLCTDITMSSDPRPGFRDIYICANSIAVELLDSFDRRIKASIERVAKEGVDTDRMRVIIRMSERSMRNTFEHYGGNAFSNRSIYQILYGKEDLSDMEPMLDHYGLNSQLRNWTSQQWTDLLTKYFITPECVVLRAKPSAAMVVRLEEDEKVRLARQRESLGEEGLTYAAKRLNDAKAEHDRPIPNDILTSFPIPDPKNISWITVQAVLEPGRGREPPVFPCNSPELERYIEADGQPLSFFVQYSHVQSDFVSITAALSLSKLPERLRPYLSLYVNAFYSLPIERHTGERLSFEEANLKLDDEIERRSAGIHYGEYLAVDVFVEVDKYDVAVGWLYDLIFGSVFDPERLQSCLAQTQSDYPLHKRDGTAVLGAVLADMTNTVDSVSQAVNITTQIEFVAKLAEQLKEDPDEVVRALEEVRKALTDPSGIRFSVAGNVLGLSHPRSALSKYFANALPECVLSPIAISNYDLSEIGHNPSRKAVVVSVPTSDSSYLSYLGKGIRDYTHPDYAAFCLTIAILNANEGYLWRAVRGSGLAYSVSVSADHEEGHLFFYLYRCSNCLRAIEEAYKVILGLADGSITLEQTALDAAKSSGAYEVASSLSTPSAAAKTVFTYQILCGLPQSFGTDLLEQYRTITVDDIVHICRTYFVPLLDPRTSIVVSTHPPGRSEEVATFLCAKGYDVERRVVAEDLQVFTELES